MELGNNLKNGLDSALGATLGGMAGQFLKAAAVSTEQAVEMMKLTKRQIEVTMFAAGVEKLDDLTVGKLVINHESYIHYSYCITTEF